jgi:hypothetical protein
MHSYQLISLFNNINDGNGPAAELRIQIKPGAIYDGVLSIENATPYWLSSISPWRTKTLQESVLKVVKPVRRAGKSADNVHIGNNCRKHSCCFNS